MRLFLLPISTRRTLIYCKRLDVANAESSSWLDKGTAKAASIWAGWEKKEKGWQKKVVDYGNQALKRIPFEEWGLKSIPALSTRKQADEASGKDKVEVIFPASIIPEETVLEVLRKLGTERQTLHRKWLIGSFIGMPISAPVALIPIIPNLPFFYLCYRAYSNYKALAGSKHVEYLVDKQLIERAPSKILDELYSNGRQPFHMNAASNASQSSGPEEIEEMILQKSILKPIATALDVPELEIELERAVWQVENALNSERELREEKKELELNTNSAPNEKKL